MVALFTVLLVVLVSMLIVRVATVAFTLTGMSREQARFQAMSALGGVGFTTRESELITGHPVRRRIALVLIVLGSAGLVTAVSTLILSFGSANNPQRLGRAGILLGGLLVLWLVARNRWVDRRLSALIARVLAWRGFQVRDFANLLDLEGDYAVGELLVEADDWIAGRTLAELRLRDEGIAVLGIHREGGYTGNPHGDATVEPGDRLVLYGKEERIEEIDRRKKGGAGDEEHRRAQAVRV